MLTSTFSNADILKKFNKINKFELTCRGQKFIYQGCESFSNTRWTTFLRYLYPWLDSDLYTLRYFGEKIKLYPTILQRLMEHLILTNNSSIRDVIWMYILLTYSSNTFTHLHPHYILDSDVDFGQHIVWTWISSAYMRYRMS